MNHSKVAIIGAGPAGISCAVQLKRYGIEPLLFEKNQIGGLLRNANLVENYLGFEKGISGKNLVKEFRKNLEDSGISPLFSEVKKISFSDSERNFHIFTDDALYTSEILVVASGTKPKNLCHSELVSESIQQSKPILNTGKMLKQVQHDNFVQNDKVKIFYEIADLPKKDYSGKQFAVIGAGDAAFDYALNLVNNYNASKVLILNRGNKAKCLPILEKRALETGKIEHLININVGNNTIVEADYIIVAIGRETCLDFLDEELAKNSFELQNQGLFYIIGDAVNGDYRQISIATGDGIKSAVKIYTNS